MVRTTPRNSRPSTLAAWIVWIAGTTVTVATAGCAQPADDGAGEASEDAIFGGVRDDDGRGGSNVVALRVGNGGTFDLCSGAVIAPNVVLTARHCVARTVSDAISCDENGRSASGPQLAGDQAPEDVAVFVGATPSFSRTPSALVKTIIAPEGDALCDSDIALLVLDRNLEGVTPFAVRFAAQARLGEEIRAVGYGKNDAKTPMGTRFRRENVPVLAIGKGISPSKTRLGPHEFEVGKSICEGDSGGPAISELTGAVIGVVSRGGPCGDDFGHVYTSTAGFEDLFARAFTAAGDRPIVEANTPPEDVAAVPKASADPAPPEPAPAPKAGGCAMSSSSRTAPGAGLFALIGLALLGRRRSTPRAR